MGPEVQIKDCSPLVCLAEPKILWYKIHVLHLLPFKFRGGRWLPAVDNRNPRQKSIIWRGAESVEGVWPNGLVYLLHLNFTEQPQ